MKIEGAVQFVDLEIGFWGIETEDGEKYIPVNMPEQLKREGMKISVRAEKVRDVAGFQQWGEYVRIVSFET